MEKRKIKEILPYLIIVLIAFSLIAWGGIGGYKASIANKVRDDCRFVSIKLEQPEFLIPYEANDKIIYSALKYYNVKYPHIVYAQAILETGYFRSRVFKEKNNLFGLYNSRKHDYFKFDHWSESIIAYKKYIQYRFNVDKNEDNDDSDLIEEDDEEYYKFLSKIGYAEDPLYINKLKEIVKQNKDFYD